MTLAAANFRACLEAGDVDGLRAIWSQVAPHLPQPETREQAEIVMHRARTEAASMPLRARAYSHAWLLERALPSGLPDELKPAAERLYPRVAEAVGISVNTRSEFFKPAALLVRTAMEGAVLELHADGVSLSDPLVPQRMAEAKRRELRALFGGPVAR